SRLPQDQCVEHVLWSIRQLRLRSPSIQPISSEEPLQRQQLPFTNDRSLCGSARVGRTFPSDLHHSPGSLHFRNDGFRRISLSTMYASEQKAHKQGDSRKADDSHTVSS